MDGLLACVSRETEKFDHFQAFVDRGIPLVFFDCVSSSIDTYKVVVDDENAGFMATKHLIESGSRKIAYLGGPISLEINKERYLGYQRALLQHSIPLDEQIVIHTSGNYEEGLIQMDELLAGTQIDGVFAGTDMLGISAIKSCKKKGLRVPEDVAIVGFSDWTISRIYEPTLSTIKQPGEEMGFKAAELLIHQLNNPDNQQFETITLKTDLIVRESSKRS